MGGVKLDVSVQCRKGAVGGIVRALRECYQGNKEGCSSVGGFLGGDEVKCLQSSMLQGFHGHLNMHVCTHVMHTYMTDTNM